MKNGQYIFLILLILVFIFCDTITAAAMDTGFETDALSETEQEKIRENLDIALLTEEPEKRSIDCFDVREDGTVAIGTSVLERVSVCVYTNAGIFQYGYTFASEGSYGTEWDGDNIIIYFVRSNLAVSVDPDGKVTEILEIQNNSRNNSYWNYNVFAKKRIVGDNEYVIKNNMGLLNLFESSYSQLVVTGNGKSHIIYDVNTMQLVKYIVLFVAITSFFGFAVFKIVKRFTVFCTSDKEKEVVVDK